MASRALSGCGRRSVGAVRAMALEIFATGGTGRHCRLSRPGWTRGPPKVLSRRSESAETLFHCCELVTAAAPRIPPSTSSRP